MSSSRPTTHERRVSSLECSCFTVYARQMTSLQGGNNLGSLLFPGGWSLVGLKLLVDLSIHAVRGLSLMDSPTSQ